MKLHFFCRFLFCIFSFGLSIQHSCQAQLLTPRLVGGVGDQSGTGIVQTPDSGFIVVGRQLVNGVNSGLITYFNKTQNVVWAKVLRVGTDAQIIDAEVTSSGICVYGQTTLNGELHIMFVKMNFAGAVIRQRYFNTGSSLIIPAQLIALRNGNLAYTSITGSGERSIIGCLDSLFNPLWTRNFSNGQLNQVRSIVKARDGGLLFTGGWIGSGGTAQCYYGKLDPQGNTRWIHTIDGPDMEVGLGICEGDSNAIYVSGYEFSDNRDAFLFRTDSLNRIRWTRRYNANQEYFLNVVLLADGNVACSGDIADDNTGSHFLTIVKFDKINGAKLWDKELQGNYNSVTGRGKSLMALPNGLVNIIGSANPSIAVDGYDLIWAMMDLQGNGCSSRSVVGATLTNYPFGAPVGNPSIADISLPTAQASIALSDANFCNKDACTGTLNTRILGADVTLCDTAYTIRPEIFPNSSYQWVNGPSTPEYTVHNSGQYIVNVSSACGSFADTIRVTLSQLQLRVSPATASLCSGDSLTLVAFTSSGSQVAWSGSPNLSNLTGDSTVLAALNQGNTPVNITVTAQASSPGSGCPPVSRQVQVQVYAAVRIDAGPDTVLCGKDNSATLGSATNRAGLEYQWRPSRYLNDAFSPRPTVTHPGIDTVRSVRYKLLATDLSSGCKAADSVTITFNSVFQSDQAGPDVELCSGQHAEIGSPGSAIPESQFFWTPALWLSSANRPKVTITPVLDDSVRQARRYPYILSYSYGSNSCTVWQDTVWVTVHPRLEVNAQGNPVCAEPLLIPNVVTPNEDGKNDSFRIRSIELYPQNSIHIYNRWGNQVYTAEPYTNQWVPETPGIYFFRLDIPTISRTYKGWIEVVK